MHFDSVVQLCGIVLVHLMSGHAFRVADEDQENPLDSSSCAMKIQRYAGQSVLEDDSLLP